MQNSRKMQANPQFGANNRGVTLIEVIAVIAVLSVVLAAVTAFLLTGVRMSAQVSGSAKFSIREQTAVEFINKALYKSTVTLVDPQGENVDEGSKLALTSSETTATLYS